MYSYGEKKAEKQYDVCWQVAEGGKCSDALDREDITEEVTL